MVALSGCAGGASAPEAPVPSSGVAATEGALARAGLTGLDAVAAIERLDASPDARPLGFTASVRPHELVLSDETGEYRLPVPQDRFYVSIAPYRAKTHDCFNHSLATCRGELAGQQVHLLVTASDGTVLVDRDDTLYANGFVGMWLPRDQTGTIRVTQEGLAGEIPFATADDSATCLTTLRLT